jgi:hypothetical protein
MIFVVLKDDISELEAMSRDLETAFRANFL